MSKVHEVKCRYFDFEDMFYARKTFDLLENDKDFKAGDDIRYMEWDPEYGHCTGRFFQAEICYTISGENGLEDDYIIVGLTRIEVMRMDYVVQRKYLELVEEKNP